ncbi:hypothetical protein [Erythrobacter sp. SG61-1L]|uniref:hypothetical protein n=1 Tax=Erythrobacter sp. SG61-1L TaxID=1603897 RepID=UPI0012E141AE|nr:hypothetical protein [Erythrobacter sp. SG61-1L]
MMDEPDNATQLRRVKTLLCFALGLCGVLILVLLVMIAQLRNISDAGASDDVYTDQSEPVEAELPIIEEPIIDEAVPNVPDVVSGSTIFDTSANLAHEAYYAPEGRCYVLFAKSTGQLLRAIEDDLGRRVESHEAFPDGMIVNFQGGARIAVWMRGIDCKDPQYDPFDRGSGVSQ